MEENTFAYIHICGMIINVLQSGKFDMDLCCHYGTNLQYAGIWVMVTTFKETILS
jgi:hypothetical protein